MYFIDDEYRASQTLSTELIGIRVTRVTDVFFARHRLGSQRGRSCLITHRELNSPGVGGSLTSRMINFPNLAVFSLSTVKGKRSMI